MPKNNDNHCSRVFIPEDYNKDQENEGDDKDNMIYLERNNLQVRLFYLNKLRCYMASRRILSPLPLNTMNTILISWTERGGLRSRIRTRMRMGMRIITRIAIRIKIRTGIKTRITNNNKNSDENRNRYKWKDKNI